MRHGSESNWISKSEAVRRRPAPKPDPHRIELKKEEPNAPHTQLVKAAKPTSPPVQPVPGPSRSAATGALKEPPGGAGEVEQLLAQLTVAVDRLDNTDARKAKLSSACRYIQQQRVSSATPSAVDSL